MNVSLIKSQSSEDLIQILLKKKGDYTSEAVTIIEQELALRGYNLSELSTDIVDSAPTGDITPLKERIAGRVAFDFFNPAYLRNKDRRFFLTYFLMTIASFIAIFMFILLKSTAKSLDSFSFFISSFLLLPSAYALTFFPEQYAKSYMSGPFIILRDLFPNAVKGVVYKVFGVILFSLAFLIIWASISS